MDRFAQRRSIRSRIWEGANLSGIALEEWHSEVAAAMNTIRTTDEQIRAIAENIKPLFRQAKVSLRQRDYMSCSDAVSDFHHRVRQISYYLEKLVKADEIKHYNFMLAPMDSAKKDKVLNYDPNAEIKEACENFDELVKEAGIYDWMKDKVVNTYDLVGDTASNLLSEKGRVRRLLEKRFSGSGFLDIVKSESISIVKETEKMQRHLLVIFNSLESGVSRRNIKHYIVQSKLFITKFNEYHKNYLNYHEKVIIPLRKYQNELNKEEALKKEELAVQKQKEEAEAKEVEQVRQHPLVTPYVDNTQNIESVQKPEYKEKSFEEFKIEEEKKKILDRLEREDEESEPLSLDLINVKNEPKKPSPLQKQQSNIFIDELVSHAKAHNIDLFVQSILKQSEAMEEINPTASEELARTAYQLVNDYKTAGIFDIFKGKKPQEEVNVPVPRHTNVEPEWQRGNVEKKEKPQELVDQDSRRLKKIEVDLPNGRLEMGYSDIPLLSTITPNKMRISPDTVNHLKNMVVRRLINVLNISDFSPYLKSFDANFVNVLKQSIYDGWVVECHSAVDEFNPGDKLLDVYIRLPLSKLDNKLQGTAKIQYVKLRVSALHGTVTIRNLNRYFQVDGGTSQQPRPTPTNPPSNKQPTPKPVEDTGPTTKRTPDHEEDIEDVDFDDGRHDYPDE